MMLAKLSVKILVLLGTLCLAVYSAPSKQSSPLTFFYNNDPMLRNDLFEGDIQLEEGQLLQTPKGLYQKPVSRENWPNGIVPYIISSVFTASEQAVIFNAMKLIEDQTRVNGKDCIKFQARTNQATYLSITSQSGCWSYVGKQKQAGAQELSLQRPSGPGAGHCVWLGTTAHELIHALGFFHEQSRPDRDNYVEILYQNINPSTSYNFDKMTTGVDTLGVPYDLWSIMHYEWNSFSINGQPTVKPKDPSIPYTQLVNAAYKNALTDTDVAEIRKAYGCQ